MESRYESNQIKKTNDGRRVFRPKIYPNIPLKESDIYAAIETGDRLDSLAFGFYGDSSLWWIIAAANNIHGANITLEEGTIIRIPMDYINILRDFTE